MDSYGNMGFVGIMPDQYGINTAQGDGLGTANMWKEQLVAMPQAAPAHKQASMQAMQQMQQPKQSLFGNLMNLGMTGMKLYGMGSGIAGMFGGAGALPFGLGSGDSISGLTNLGTSSGTTSFLDKASGNIFETNPSWSTGQGLSPTTVSSRNI